MDDAWLSLEEYQSLMALHGVPLTSVAGVPLTVAGDWPHPNTVRRVKVMHPAHWCAVREDIGFEHY